MTRSKPKLVRMPLRRRRSGFTLIELLVVIAIIALLIAILLPSLEAARRQAKMSACLSHIKNIASSSRVYEADDPQGWGIPVHPAQFWQERNNPTFIGAYEWGGKSGIGRADYLGPANPQNSKYGTKAGFGPATRPMNAILYKGGFKDSGTPYDRIGAHRDTELDLGLFKCPADDGPPRGGHCTDWVAHSEQSSYDHFGNSYAANVFMVAIGSGGLMHSNSPYMRPITRVPTPARTIYYEENIGRWAWAAKRDRCELPGVTPGVDPGPTKAIRGWHGRDWTYNRAFVDAHAETQKIIIEGTQDENGYALHYVAEKLSSYPKYDANNDGVPETPGGYEFYHCVIVRGPGWAKDTLPATPIETQLWHPGGGRPSYEDCVAQTD
ncbi:MAG: prepilin-type N-terminal cleavage/methylation domain-containing protein [Planctomycetota bacterium]|jgi:prepilin-type N-terminal cleavage/methylation domain-containing protein